MKNNQPVTGQEYQIRSDSALISHTDDKGRITRANDEFAEASGFTREELVGQSHNIVRHPDMPVEAFRDLWATLKRGRPWTGLVKNRRKNGDHYWVRANVSPTADGYASVRSKPSRQEVDAAESLYRNMRNDAGIKLDGGYLVPSGLAGLKRRLFGRLRIAQRLWLMVGLSTLLFVAAVAIGWQGLSAARDSLRSVYEDRAVPMYDLSKFNSLIKENYADILRGFQHDPAGQLHAAHDHPPSIHIDAVKNRRVEFDALWNKFMATHMTKEEKVLAADFTARRQAWTEKLGVALAALEANDYSPAVMAAFLSAGRAEGRAAEVAMDKLMEYQVLQAKQEFEAARKHIGPTRCFSSACW